MMKTKTKSVITNRIRLIVVLVLLITTLLAAVSYAWFRNTIEVPGVNLQTGTFQYQFIGYHRNAASSELMVDFAYSTMAGEFDTFNPETGEGYYPILQDGTLTAVTDHTNITNDIQTPGEVYYVVRKLDQSVDIDISINLEAQLDKLKDFSGSADSLEAVGGFWYSVVDITGTAESRLLIEQAIKDSTVFQVDGTDKQEKREEYFPNIRDEFLTATLDDTNEYWCFRLRYGIKSEADTSAYAGKKIDLAVNLCVAQKGGLEGDESSKREHYVSTLQQFKDALLVYMPYDAIIVQGDITYEGDLIFNRPVKLHIVGSKLTVKGNMRFNYAYPGSFEINTSLAGQLYVLKMDDVDAGGNLYIDAHESSVEFIGLNSSEAGAADVYVENVFSADVYYDTGLIITRSRIAALDDKYKTIYLRNESTIEVYARTTVGTVTVHNDGKASTRAVRIRVINKGTIEEINLVNMGYVPGAYGDRRIIIDNYGNIERNGVSTPIKLPNWSCKWYEELDGQGARDKNNTQIVHQQGAGFMSVGSTGHKFKSDGSGIASRDDIDYINTGILVEMDPDNKNIIVNYMEDERFVHKTELGEIISDETSLENIISYYLPGGEAETDEQIAALQDIVSLKIICYGRYSLTEEDYAFIRTMSGLKSIDLSEAISAERGAEGRTIPDNAFAGLSSLKYVTLSDSDNTLGNDLFVGTNVDEIRLPVNVKFIGDTTLTGIKYLHVGNKADLVIEKVPNYSSIYLFCADENTREKFILSIEAANGATERYKEKTSNPSATELNRISRIFLDAERVGDYFVNIYDNACYIITYVGNTFDAGKEQTGYSTLDYFGNEVYYKFDFATLRIGNKVYQVAGYDDFAFYGKTIASWIGTDLKFSDQLASIGDAAFYNTALPKNIDLGGCKTLGHLALACNSNVRVLKGDKVETLGFWACGELKKIQFIYLPSATWNYGSPFGGQSSEYPTRLDLGLLQTAPDAIDKTASGYHKLYANKSNDANTTLFVHNDNLTNEVVALTPFTKKPYRAFAPADCLSLLSAAGCTASSLGEYNASDVKFMADYGLEFGAYAYLQIKDTDNYELISYMNKTTIDFLGEDYVVPAYTDENGVVYNTTTIRASAFHYAGFTGIDTLTFADSYETIGNNALNFVAAGKKYYDHLDLNNVKSIGSSAFAASTAVTITGNKLTSAGTNAFNNSANLITVSLKNLSSAGQAFNGCSSLKMAAVGPVYGSNIFVGCSKLEFVFVNVTGVTKAPGTAYLVGSSVDVPFTVVSIGGEFSWEKSPNSPYKAGVENPFKYYVVEEGVENVLFSDWKEKSFTANGKEHTIYFPSFMYVKQEDDPNELTLLLSFEFERITKNDYVLPDIIYRIGGDETITTILGDTVPKHTYIAAADGSTINEGLHVTRIESGAFKKLLNVTNITFPHSLEYIGESAFEECTFGDVVLNGDGTLIIGQRAFYGATMESLTLVGVSSISKEAFAAIKGQTETTVVNAVPVHLGSVIYYIGESAFEGSQIASVTSTHNSANNIELTIERYAFRAIVGETSGEISVDFGGAYVVLGERVFEGVKLSNVLMPNMRLISQYAFNKANISGKLDLSGSGGGIVPTIMPYAFKGESSSQKMTIGQVLLGTDTLVKGDFSIKDGAMYGTDGKQVYEGGFTDCKIGTIDFASAKQPEALAFVRCNFENMYFGEMEEFSVNVTGPGSIDYSAAANQSIDHPYMVTDAGKRRNNTDWTKFIFRDCTGYGNVYFESVTRIGGYAFGRNSTTVIQHVEFTNVKQIDTYAFRYIHFKEGITLGEDVTLAAQAFQVGTIDGTAYLGDGLKMGSYAFINVNFTGTLSIGSYTSSTTSSSNFASTANYAKTINKVVFRDKCTAIPAYSFALMYITEIDFTNIKTIGTKAFADTQIGTAYNMDGVMTIGANAFGRFATDKSYVVPEIKNGFDVSGVVSIGSEAFAGNTINQKVDLSSAESIGTTIFKNTTINADVTFGDRTTVVSGMFDSATITGSFDFSNITTIESGAFKNAKLSQDLVFDGSLSIAENAFDSAKLNNVTFVGGGALANEAFANSSIKVLKLGALSSIAGATPTVSDDGAISDDTTGSFHHANISELYIENATDPEPLSFAYATIGTLNYGNLTKSGVTSGADANGFKTPFYAVTAIKEIDFGLLQTLGDYYFTNVEITTIKDMKNMTLVGDYAFRNCLIYSDMVFEKMVEFRTGALYSTKVYGNLTLSGGLTASSSTGATGMIASNSVIYEDLYIKQLTGSIGTNDYIMASSQVMKKFTIDGGTLLGAFNSVKFNGDVDLSKVTDMSSSNGVFLYCSFLCKRIDMSSLKSVKYQLFYSGSFANGTELYFDVATSVADKGLRSNKGVTKVILSAATSVGAESFSSCADLTTVIAPKLSTVGNKAFSSCTKLTTLDMPEVTSIGTSSFESCTALVTASFPKAKTVGHAAFQKSTALQVVNLPSVTTITGGASGAYSFVYNCSALQKIILGSNFKGWTGAGALISGCSSLKQVVIMSDPTNITGTSMGLPSNAKIVAPRSMESKYDALFEANSTLWGSVTKAKLTYVERLLSDGNITYIATVVGNESDNKIEISGISDFGADSIGTRFEFPSALDGYTVVSIGSEAIKALVGVETVVLPSTLEYINFSGIHAPTSIVAYEISEENPIYKHDANGMLYSKDGKTLVICPSGIVGEITLDEGVTVIGENAFAGNVFVTKINIAQQVIVADGAFAHCVALSEISFTSNQASMFIGRGIIEGCSSSLVITVPSASLDNYKQFVFYDTDLVNRIVSAS